MVTLKLSDILHCNSRHLFRTRHERLCAATGLEGLAMCATKDLATQTDRIIHSFALLHFWSAAPWLPLEPLLRPRCAMEYTRSLDGALMAEVQYL